MLLLQNGAFLLLQNGAFLLLATEVTPLDLRHFDPEQTAQLLTRPGT